MNFLTSRRLVHRTLVIACAAAATSCATGPDGQRLGMGEQLKETFASDEPCAKSSRNTGVLLGALAGAVVSRALGERNRESLLLGAGIGGLLGGLIGADLDRKRCELYKVAKQYDLEIRFEPIDANGQLLAEAAEAEAAPAARGDTQPKPETTAATTSGNEPKPVATANNTGAPPPKPAVVGTVLTVRDKGGAQGHFDSGSDQLTPKAREYFAAIAAQYSEAKMLEGQADTAKRAEVGRLLASRRILLVGHTDDTGSSSLNASLSERRARAVATYLKQLGIAEESLFFQGAGETLPIADNRTEAGRAANRRVELLEVKDESVLKKYLAERLPNYAFYRPTEAAPAQPEPAVATASMPSKPNPAPSTARSPAVPAPQAAASTPAAPQAPARPGINFGGNPYTPAEATLTVTPSRASKRGLTLVSKAYAEDTVVMNDCTRDRPRLAGSVKSLRNGSSYRTNEHLPQLYGKTWAAAVNGHLVVMNRVAVLKESGAPANLPEFKVYAQYRPELVRMPEVNEEPQVNSYLVAQGVLYRMFPRNEGAVRCVDVLFALDGSTHARAGKIVYGAGQANYVANFKPQMQ